MWFYSDSTFQNKNYAKKKFTYCRLKRKEDGSVWREIFRTNVNTNIGLCVNARHKEKIPSPFYTKQIYFALKGSFMPHTWVYKVTSYYSRRQDELFFCEFKIVKLWILSHDLGKKFSIFSTIALIVRYNMYFLIDDKNLLTILWKILAGDVFSLKNFFFLILNTNATVRRQSSVNLSLFLQYVARCVFRG